MLTALAPGAVRGDVESGMRAYSDGNYATAFAEFLTAAKAGDPRAQYNLGVLYLSGRGVEKDLRQALKWHREAAEQGLSAAQHGLGMMYYRGQGIDRNFAVAAGWIRKSADQGLAEAQFNLAVMYFKGEGVQKNLPEVIKWVSLSAGQGYMDAMFRLGVMYEQGTGLDRNLDEALKWFRRAMDKGHDKAPARVAAVTAAKSDDRKLEQARAQDIVAAPEPAPEPAAKQETAQEKAPSPLPVAATPASVPKPVQAAAPALPPPFPAHQPAPAARGQSAAAGWRVQFASLQDAARARAIGERLQRLHGDGLDGARLFVRRADLGPGRGIYFRVQAGPFATDTAAQDACGAVRRSAPGQACMVVSP